MKYEYIHGLVENPDEKRPRGKISHKWRNNVTGDMKQDGMALSWSETGGLF
jgi:hypothetical protein